MSPASSIGKKGGVYVYPVDRDTGRTFEFQTAEDVFFPTHTSQLLIKGTLGLLRSHGKLLDLGCGIGVCGLVLAKLGMCKLPVYLSDVSESATRMARVNAEALRVPAEVRSGSLFGPWRRERFDVIVDDVSGVCEEIAKISPWFPEGVECKTGPEGTALIIQVLEQAPQHLNPGGILLFPVLSLSNEKRVLETAQAHFSEVSLVAEQAWFLPEEMLKHFNRFEPFLKTGVIRLEQKFGTWLWSTKVFKASSPRDVMHRV